MNNQHPQQPLYIKGLFGVAGALFVAALVVYGNALSTGPLAGVADTQVASFGWASNNTGLQLQSPGPSDDKCAHNNNEDSATICVQYNEKNIFGLFTVNERSNNAVGAGSYFRALTNNDANHLGWRALWRLPQITINGTAYGPGGSTGAYGFVTATFKGDGPNQVSFSLGGDIYTAGNTATNQNKNKEQIENGLVQLAADVSTVRGGGITVAAGTPLQLEWQCQNYQLQLFGAWCNPAIGAGDRECTTGRKIDGFNASDASASNPTYFSDGTSFSNITSRVSSAPQPFTVYKDTTLNLRCVSPSNSGQKRIGMYIPNTGWDGDALVQWSIPSRTSPWMTLSIDTINDIGGHGITANPMSSTVGSSAVLTWYATWAQRCKVTGPNGFDTGWSYGSNCNTPINTATPTFASPVPHTYSLTYVTYDINGVEHTGTDSVTINVSCPANQTNQGGTCVSDTNCPPGQHWNGTQCVADAPQSCDAGYHLDGGVCVPDVQATPVVTNFRADPARVRKGGSTTLSWTGTDLPPTCTLSSTPAITGFPGDYATPKDAGPIDQTTIFTLTCGSGTSAQRTVTVIPSFEEI